jgi:hypothetical protein
MMQLLAEPLSPAWAVTQRILQLADRRRWFQSDLADRAGITRRRFYDAVRFANFTDDELHDIAEALRVPIETVLDVSEVL